MPPRPAAPCSRALRRQLGNNPDTVWITDNLLAAVFERYCVVSHEARRRACNVPGPFEARRRLGKRQIGGLNALQNPSGLPDWSLPVIDLSKWSWQPPTPFSLRQEKLQEAGQPSESTEGELPAWLGRWLQPSSKEVEVQTAESTSGQSSVHTSTSPVKALDAFQTLVHTQPMHELVLACETLCHRLGEDTEMMAGLGEDKDEVLDALDNVWAALDARLGGSSDDALGIFTQLYSTLLASGLTVPVSPHHSLDSRLSNRLLAQIAKLPASDQLCELLELAMRSVPPSCSEAVKPPLLDILDKFFISWCQGTWNSRQTQLLARALSTLHPTVANALGRDAKRLLLEQSQPPEMMCHARYAWLDTVARVPAFRFWFFKAGLKQFFGEPAMAGTLSTRQICELLLTQWTHTGRKPPGAVKGMLDMMSAKDESTSLGSLIYSLYIWDQQWEDHVVQLCNSLRAVGRLGETAVSLRHLRGWLEQQELNSYSRLLGKMMALCGDFKLALRLHEQKRKLQTGSQGREQWNSTLWEQYLVKAVSDKSTHPADVCRLLEFSEKNEQTTAIAINLAKAFARDTQLTDRAALRYLVVCKTFLQRRGRKLSPQVLDAMYTVVTRDLKRGEMGRTSRLRWLVNTVHQECGEAMAERVAGMLHGWRGQIKKVRARQRERGEKVLREEEFGHLLLEDKKKTPRREQKQDRGEKLLREEEFGQLLLAEEKNTPRRKQRQDAGRDMVASF